MHKTRASSLCWCGSGREGIACHGLPRRERRRRKDELYVLAEAGDIAALFPEVRPRDDVLAAWADRAASELHRDGPRVPVEVVEQGLALLGPSERDSIVGSWRRRFPERWSALVAHGGDEALIERAVIAGAVRVAVLERVPPPRDLLESFEGGLYSDLPANALTLLVPPPAVWSIDDVVSASGLRPLGAQFDPRRFDAIERHARGCVSDEQLTRLREAAARLDAGLPVEGLPRASATVAAGCDVVATDDGWCAAIAARQLAIYASDPRFARIAAP